MAVSDKSSMTGEDLLKNLDGSSLSDMYEKFERVTCVTAIGVVVDPGSPVKYDFQVEDSSSTWVIRRRYNDFVSLANAFQLSELKIALPGRGIKRCQPTGNNSERTTQRMLDLGKWILFVLDFFATQRSICEDQGVVFLGRYVHDLDAFCAFLFERIESQSTWVLPPPVRAETNNRELVITFDNDDCVQISPTNIKECDLEKAWGAFEAEQEMEKLRQKND